MNRRDFLKNVTLTLTAFLAPVLTPLTKDSKDQDRLAKWKADILRHSVSKHFIVWDESREPDTTSTMRFRRPVPYGERS